MNFKYLYLCRWLSVNGKVKSKITMKRAKMLHRNNFFFTTDAEQSPPFLTDKLTTSVANCFSDTRYPIARVQNIRLEVTANCFAVSTYILTA